MTTQTVTKDQRWMDGKTTWQVISVKNGVAVLKRVGRGTRRNHPEFMYRPVDFMVNDMKLKDEGR